MKNYKFIKDKHENSIYVDNVFAIINLSKNDESKEKINATIGSLYDEEGKIYTYKTVFDVENNMDNKIKASYCGGPQGNDDFLRDISKFVLENRITNNYGVISTPGGTGGLSLSLELTANENDTILYPEISWGNYKNIANGNNLNIVNYDLYSLEDLLNKIDYVDGRIILIINSPCENPTGHSYCLKDWETIINKLNSLDKEVVLINDLAYLDYANENAKEYFKLFNSISDNVLVLMAYSCSKSFSFYGERLGALIAINNNKEFIDFFINQCTKKARALWSNVNNGAMKTVSEVLENHYEEYTKELQANVDLIKERSNMLLEELDKQKIEYYPYTEGFFVTIKVKDNVKRDEMHKMLIDKHLYTIKVNKGIRISVCSIAKKDIKRAIEIVKSVYC